MVNQRHKLTRTKRMRGDSGRKKISPKFSWQVALFCQAGKAETSLQGRNKLDRSYLCHRSGFGGIYISPHLCIFLKKLLEYIPPNREKLEKENPGLRKQDSQRQVKEFPEWEWREVPAWQMVIRHRQQPVQTIGDRQKTSMLTSLKKKKLKGNLVYLNIRRDFTFLSDFK